MRTLLLLLVLGLTIAPGALRAQYASTQAETLKDLDRVLVLFVEPNEEIDPQILQELYQSATLELRKVGIRISTDPDEIDMTRDAILNVTIVVVTGFPDSATLRMDVEQRATLVRTGETKQMVTWFYEGSRSGGSWRNWTRSLLMDGVNEFLSDWLDANGR